MGVRRPDQRRELPSLCRRSIGRSSEAWGYRDPRQFRLAQGKTVRDVIRAAGARLFFLPTYSPDLNPIEQVFAKHLLRKAAKRTVEATWRQIGALLDDFSPEECQRYLVNAGYGST